jgi:protein phosphatase
LLRGAQLEQITRDHTVAQEYIDQGLMSESEAKDSRLSHVLWNTVGDDSYNVHPEIHKAELQLGDKLLLCTDGLTRHVANDQIAQLLRKDKRSDELSVKLVDMANESGGSDNITVIVAQFNGTRPEPHLLESTEVVNPTKQDEPVDVTPPKGINVR